MPIIPRRLSDGTTRPVEVSIGQMSADEYKTYLANDPTDLKTMDEETAKITLGKKTVAWRNGQLAFVSDDAGAVKPPQ